MKMEIQPKTNNILNLLMLWGEYIHVKNKKFKIYEFPFFSFHPCFNISETLTFIQNVLVTCKL